MTKNNPSLYRQRSKTMTNPKHCPHCNADLRGVEIPEEHRQFYGSETHFRRDILVQIQGIYDGGLYYQCPDCGGQWHRFPEGHRLRAIAEKFIRKEPVNPRKVS